MYYYQSVNCSTQVTYRIFKLTAPDLMSMYRYFISTFVLVALPVIAFSEWDVVTHTNTDNNTQTKVAYTENSDGYSLEIYRDANDAIRSRFGMNQSLHRIAEKSCPTYQVDRRLPENRSINDAACIPHRQWAEFVLGYIVNDEIISTPLHNMMNGNSIIYRFILENGGYAETRFSLLGSKRTLTEILGSNITIRTDKGFTAN